MHKFLTVGEFDLSIRVGTEHGAAYCIYRPTSYSSSNLVFNEMYCTYSVQLSPL